MGDLLGRQLQARPHHSMHSARALKSCSASSVWLSRTLLSSYPDVALVTRPLAARAVHSSAADLANPLPFTGTGPPPAPAVPSADQPGERVDRRKKQAELLKKGQELRQVEVKKPRDALKKRFWKDVSVKRNDDGHHTIHLDARAVRHPTQKTPLPIPKSKPHLATALALEWDQLVSAQQALKNHYIPLTSLAARAHDIAVQDRDGVPASHKSAREDIIKNLMRYFETDTLLCWAPEPDHPASAEPSSSEPPTLRATQIATATPIVRYLSTHVWPGVEIVPALEGPSILPAAQPEATQAVVRGWLAALGAWELAGLERAVLAGKSLCVGVRLVVEWGESFADLRRAVDDAEGEVEVLGERFGVEKAAQACSLEVSWQTGMWGEVEDTHDVDKEDLRRQLGSVVLLVSGEAR